MRQSLEEVLIHQESKLTFVCEVLSTSAEGIKKNGTVRFSPTATYGLERILGDIADELKHLNGVLPAEVLNYDVHVSDDEGGAR